MEYYLIIPPNQACHERNGLMFTFLNSPAAKPDVSMNFARRRSRGYMMRSEKRTHPQNSAQGGRRPVRKRRKAGFFYILLALLLSLVLWPIGMIMIWKRKVRWTISSKLLTTIITLFLSVTMFGFALTVQTDNVKFTKVQDRVNDFIDNGAVYISEGYTAICDGAVRVWNSAADLGDAAGRVCLTYLADGIDEGADLTGKAVAAVTELLAKDQPIETPVVTDAPTDTPTDAPTDGPTAAPTTKATPEVTGEGELPLTVPEGTPDPAEAQTIGNGTLNRDGEFTEATATPEPTDAPTDVPTAVPTAVPTIVPTAVPSAVPAVSAAASASPEATGTSEVTGTPEPTNTPEPTATPEPTNTPEPSASPEVSTVLLPDDAKDAVVYYTSNGKYYHMAATCKGMTGAKPHTLEEALARKLNRCRTCNATDSAVLNLENPVWTDEASRFHIDQECEAFEGRYNLMVLDDALANGFTPCETCSADQYMDACGRAVSTASPVPTEEPTVEPTAEPTAEPTEAPAAEPTVVTPARALKPAGEALVYHTTSGGWYHSVANCSKMTGAKLYPLSECLEGSKVYKRCRTCNAPLPEYVKEYCLWMDEEKTCHTTDECPSFTGKWTLIPRDEALEAGHTGCVVCSSEEYLQPNTTIEYIEYVAIEEIEAEAAAE